MHTGTCTTARWLWSAPAGFKVRTGFKVGELALKRVSGINAIYES